LKRNSASFYWQCGKVSHVTMFGDRLFHNQAQVPAKVQSPTVAHCNWQI